MSVLAAETGDALGCCVFWAALRGRLAEALPRLQRSYLGWANAVGRAQPAPVETAASERNVKQKVVVFKLSREQ